MPIFIYTLVGELDVLGYVIAIALIAETIHKTMLNIYGSAFKSGIHRYTKTVYPNKVVLLEHAGK